jgi:hypothetical protein
VDDLSALFLEQPAAVAIPLLPLGRDTETENYRLLNGLLIPVSCAASVSRLVAHHESRRPRQCPHSFQVQVIKRIRIRDPVPFSGSGSQTYIFDSLMTKKKVLQFILFWPKIFIT